jgi:hypothetical protein
LGEKHKSTEDPQKQKINERILSAQCDEATPSRFPQALQEQQKSDIAYNIKLAIRRVFSLSMRNIIGLEYLDLCPEINHRSQFGRIMFPFLWDGVIEDSNCFFKGILFITHDTYVIFIFYFSRQKMLKFSSK